MQYIIDLHDTGPRAIILPLAMIFFPGWFTRVIGSPGVRLVTVMLGNVKVAKNEDVAEFVSVTKTWLAVNPVPLTLHVSEKERVSGSVSQPTAIAERVKV